MLCAELLAALVHAVSTAVVLPASPLGGFGWGGPSPAALAQVLQNSTSAPHGSGPGPLPSGGAEPRCSALGVRPGSNTL